MACDRLSAGVRTSDSQASARRCVQCSTGHIQRSSAGVSLHATQHRSGFEPPFSELLMETAHGVSWLGAGRVTAAVRMAVRRNASTSDSEDRGL